MLEASNTISVHIADAYDSVNKTYSEDGYSVENASVLLYDSSNNLVFSGKTDSSGKVSIANLNPDKYSVEFRYSTYESRSQSVDLTSQRTVAIDYLFVPDILLLVDYNSHSEKVDMLMEMSKRVAYISTTDFDKTREWLFDYANFIHIDMFSEGSYNTLTGEYLRDLLKTSPANKNYNVAYTFGTYSDSFLNATGMHIVGASSSNNTFHTIENTYIGSYFQAEDIEESAVLKSNMQNYLTYIYYLINPDNYSNPTLRPETTPLMAPECGFYHTKLGLYTLVPDASLINSWIHTNPGYDADGRGSLNWMYVQYQNWLENVLDPTNLFKKFESDYKSKIAFEKPFIAIATYYYGGSVVDSLIKEYEAHGRAAFNVFKTSTTPSMSSILNKIVSTSTIGISAITSLYSWSLNYENGSAESDLVNMNLSVLKGVYDISEYSYNSELGPQIEWTYAVTFPSFEGVYGPVILSYMDNMGKSHVIQSGVEKMVKLSSAWADLKEMENKDKIVSIVLYNYPPGKAEIGASYLDVFESTYDLLFKLADAGYDVGDIEDIPSLYNFTELIVEFGNKGTWAQGLLNQYVEKYWDDLVAHNQLIDLNEFYNLTGDVNPALYEGMVTKWGDGLGEIMVYNDTYIVIPGMWFGNVFITFQPSRGWEEVQNYHDLTLPPHQQYVTFYKWLDKKVGVNAIVNMGTHGTLEWLPGKNIGVMDGDWTFELTIAPTIYPYIVSNPGEAMVARDRIAALMITHMTPAMVSSELYGNYTELSNYISRYNDQVKLNVTTNAEEYKKLIIDLAPSLGFPKYTNGSFESYLMDLHNYLDSMEDDFNTHGLHHIGKVLSDWELVEEVITVTTSQTKIYDYLLAHFFPELSNKSYYSDIKNNREYAHVKEVLISFLNEYVTALVNGSSVEKLNSYYNIAKGSSLYNATEYAAGVIVSIENNNEWDAIIGALNADYLLAGLFADPSYGDSIPTGYDGYASDSTKMPSRTAYASAVKIVDLLLANYIEEHGRWPQLTSLILWGTEISRTEGIGIAEFLYFMGCRPTWADNGKVTGVEMLPLEDLKVKLNNGSVVNRPRIDVFASIVTSNPDWLNWLLSGVKLAAFADEDYASNYVKLHYNQSGSLDRLFGLPGNILEGTGMSNLIPNTADWNITTVNAEAMDIYLDKVSFSWTLDEKGNIIITQQKEAFKNLLSKVDLITQNLDSTWRVLNSDDYYDWFGGLYNAARGLGANPDTAFVDIRNQNNYISRNYEDELEFEVRSMILNPQYYSALVVTQAGALSYASLMQNLYGSLIMGGGTLNAELGNQIASTYNGLTGSVQSTAQAAGWQSMAAWMFYLYDQGLWNGDTELVTQLADNIIQMAIQYGVACCHHTCKNLDFNMKIIQMSSLSADKKAQYAEILATATLTDPLFVSDNGDVNGDGQSEANEILVNGTESESSSGGSETAFGEMQSTSQDISKSATQSSDSSANVGESTSKDSNQQAYEISKSSPAKSTSSESSMPIFVIIAIVCIIVIFMVGYAGGRDDDEY